MARLRVGILGLRRGYSHLRNFIAVEDATVIGAADQVERWRDRARDLLTVDPIRVDCQPAVMAKRLDQGTHLDINERR